MKKIGIVTDSHSSYTRQQAEELGILVLPMPFYIDGECFQEDVSISREAFFKKMEDGAQVKTSQPSPVEVMEMWDKALEEYEEILYMPISSGLSGSYMAAAALAQEESYEKRVHVVDHGRVSTPLQRTILDALELIAEGYTARQIKEILERDREKMVIYIGVQTLEYLKKGGRITPATAALGTLLNIKPVLKLGVGTLDTYKKCRGFHKAKKEMLAALANDLETTFHEADARGDVCLLAASSSSEEETQLWVREIQEAFPGREVLSGDLSLGVCCHVGPGALGIGCSVKPGREGIL